MIFAYGKTARAEYKSLVEWRPFFALLPRAIGEDEGTVVWVWLQYIERSGLYDSSTGDWNFFYRLPENSNATEGK